MASTINVGVLRALLTADTAQFESGMREASGSLKKFQSDAQKLGQNLSTIGRDLTAAVTLPIVAAFGAAGKAAIDFESSFAGVRKTVDASPAEFKVLEQQFRNLAKQIPVNVNDLNRLGEAAGALGIPKDKIVDFTRVMAELGVTTNVTAEQAANDIAKIQNIFGASGEATENFASALVDLGNKGASSEAEILALTTRIASAGNTVGLSQAQVMGFAAAIANVGMDAEAGGSAMSRVFNDMSKAVSAGGADLQKFAGIAGMSGDAFAKLFKDDAAAATQVFIEGLGRIKEGGGDLNAVLAELGFTELRQSDLLRRLAGDSDGVGTALRQANTAWAENTALAAEAETRFGTFESKSVLLWNSLKDIGITLGNALIPFMSAAVDVLKALMPYIESAATWFAELPMPVQAVALGFAAIVAAAGPLLLIIGQISMGVAALAGLGGFAGIAAAIGALIPSWGALVAAGGAVVTFLTTTLPAAFAGVIAFLGPQGLIALALLGLAAIWYTWGDDIKAFLQPLTDWIVEKFVWVKDSLVEAWNAVVEGAGAFIRSLTDTLMDGLSAVGDWIVERFVAVKDGIALAWSTVVDTTKTFFQNLGGILRRIPTELLAPLLSPIGAVLLAFQKWPDIVRIAQQVYTGIKTWLVDRFNGIVDTVKAKVQAVSDAFKDLYIAVVGRSYVPDMVSGIEDEFGRLDNVMVRPTHGATSAVGQAFRDMKQAVLNVIDDMLRNVSTALTGWLDRFMPSWAASLIGGIAEAGINALAQMAGLGSPSGGGGRRGGIPGILLNTLTNGGRGGLLASLLGPGIAAAGTGGLLASTSVPIAAAMYAPAAIAPAAVSTGASTAAGIGTGIGMGATIGLTAGVGAAALLAWAIWKKGLFRGGDEALNVNPARDQYLGQFQQQYGGTQFEAIAKAFADQGVSGTIAEQLIRNLYNADHMDEFVAATKAIQDALSGAAAAAAETAAAVAATSDAVSSFNATIDSLQSVGTVSQEAIDSLRAQIADLKSTASPEIIQQLNDALTQMIADGTATDETVAELTNGVLALSEQSAGTTTATDAFTSSTQELEVQVRDAAAATAGLSTTMFGGADAAHAFAASIDGVRSSLGRGIDVPVRVSVSTSGGGGGGGISFAKEGIVSKPTLAMIGDAIEPEFVLHRSTLGEMVQRAFSVGSSMGGFGEMAYAGGMATEMPRGRSSGSSLNWSGNVNVTLSAAGKNAQSLARELVSAIPQAMRLDHGLIVKMRKAVDP